MKRAQTTEEALWPEAARPTTTARAAKRAADETQPTGSGAQRPEAARTNATYALNDGALPAARRLRATAAAANNKPRTPQINVRARRA